MKETVRNVSTKRNIGINVQGEFLKLGKFVTRWPDKAADPAMDAMGDH